MGMMSGKKGYTYEYARPALTVDCVVFGFGGGELEVLLIERGLEPYAGWWALPGGFVRVGEDLGEAAGRELSEEAGIDAGYLEQLGAFGAPGRDPREHVVSVAYWALVRPGDYRLAAATDAVAARWHGVGVLPRLAFDHGEIVGVAVERLRARVRHQPVGFNLLPEKFTLTELQGLYEAILGEGLDKRNFRKRVLALDLLTALPEERREGAHRPAQLFRFDPDKYARLERRGFHFEL